MQIETYNLTDKEATLAQCAGINFEYFFEETGYSQCDGDSYFLCFTLREALKTTNFDKHQIAGLISSLEAKGVIDIEHRDPVYEGPDLYWLNESFINAVARKNIAEGKGRYCFAQTYQPHLNWWGLYSPITPKTMNAFREKALWENNQRLLSQKDILKRQLAEVKATRKNIAELEAMRTAIKEAK